MKATRPDYRRYWCLHTTDAITSFGWSQVNNQKKPSRWLINIYKDKSLGQLFLTHAAPLSSPTGQKQSWYDTRWQTGASTKNVKANNCLRHSDLFRRHKQAASVDICVGLLGRGRSFFFLSSYSLLRSCVMFFLQPPPCPFCQRRVQPWQSEATSGDLNWFSAYI